MKKTDFPTYIMTWSAFYPSRRLLLLKLLKPEILVIVEVTFEYVAAITG